jgi:ATP/maltotriose-dependent transcriptional regulator MalT
MQLHERSIAFQLLHGEHEEVDRLLGEVQAHAGDLERARRLLDETLRQHMAVEEAVFYPALARLDMLASFVDRMRTQHGQIREALDALAAQSLGDAHFDAAAHRLNQLVDMHVQEEETRAFAYAAEHLAGELEALAVEMEHRRECERGAYGVG